MFWSSPHQSPRHVLFLARIFIRVHLCTGVMLNKWNKGRSVISTHEVTASTKTRFIGEGARNDKKVVVITFETLNFFEPLYQFFFGSGAMGILSVLFSVHPTVSGICSAFRQRFCRGKESEKIAAQGKEQHRNGHKPQRRYRINNNPAKKLKKGWKIN